MFALIALAVAFLLGGVAGYALRPLLSKSEKAVMSVVNPPAPPAKGP